MLAAGGGDFADGDAVAAAAEVIGECAGDDGLANVGVGGGDEKAGDF